MPITSDTRWLPDNQCGKETHPEILKSSQFAQSWFPYCLYYGDVLGLFAAGSGVADTKTLTAVTLSSWNLAHVLQRKSPLRCKRVHIKNPPAPLCSGLCISWCLDTYRSLNKEACQRGGFSTPRDYPNSETPTNKNKLSFHRISAALVQKVNEAPTGWAMHRPELFKGSSVNNSWLTLGSIYEILGCFVKMSRCAWLWDGSIRKSVVKIKISYVGSEIVKGLKLVFCEWYGVELEKRSKKKKPTTIQTLASLKKLYW